MPLYRFINRSGRTVFLPSNIGGRLEQNESVIRDLPASACDNPELARSINAGLLQVDAVSESPDVPDTIEIGSLEISGKASGTKLGSTFQFMGGVGFFGYAVATDHTLLPSDGILGVDTTLGDVTVTLPDAVPLVNNIFWQVIKLSDDSNKVLVRPAVDGQLQSAEQSLALRFRGEGVQIKTFAAGNSYWYEDASGISRSVEPEVATLNPTRTGTTLDLAGNVQFLGSESLVNAYFQYRELGSGGAWTRTANIPITSVGEYNDTVTLGAATEQEVRACAETSAGNQVCGAILNTEVDYYGDLAAALADGLVRYWPMQESSGDTSAEAVVGDTMTFTPGMTISSDTINGNTIYRRDFAALEFGEATYQAPLSSESVTFVIQMSYALASGDHTFFCNGTNRVSMAGDGGSIQAEVNGTIQAATGQNPFLMRNLAIVMDFAAGQYRMLSFDSTGVTTLVSAVYTAPTTGQFFRVGRGAVGDSNHQDNEYLEDGSVRSVAVWSRVLLDSELQAIADSLDVDGGLLVS